MKLSDRFRPLRLGDGWSEWIISVDDPELLLADQLGIEDELRDGAPTLTVTMAGTEEAAHSMGVWLAGMAGHTEFDLIRGDAE